jgi:hypothetical protein
MKKTDKQKLFEAFEKVCGIKLLKEENWNEDDDSNFEGGWPEEEYKEGKGATEEEIQSTIRKYKADMFRWQKMAANDFEAMADGNEADIKNNYYPNWKKEDFRKVIDALEDED